ncbi:MAG: T9SS type A sorting domain-containing protein [Candidatus Kapabacteria bacterium]|nr:T9SS type A sorting domain-containing protein [Candidatus Kapabacteria bacterium]
MSTYKLRYLILLILALIGLKSEMLSQESGWQQKGNLKYQIAAIDTIIQHGISISGDTLWTFCQDSTLYYWDIETGNLINKKKFDNIYRISVDLKSYMIVKMTYISSGTLFRAYIYEIQSDTLLSDALLFNIPRSDPVFTNTILVRNYDFDFPSKKLYVTTTDVISSPKDWGDQHYSHIFVIEKDTAIKILPKNFMGPDFIFNRNFTKIISCWHNSYSHKEYGTKESAYISYFDKTINKAEQIFGNSRETSGQVLPSLIVYIFPRFLNNETLMSTVIFPYIYIWDITSKKQITKFRVENQNPGIYDYCFSHSDEFIIYSNKKIYLYNTLTQSKIDSAEVDGISKNISLKYSFKNNKVLFFAGNKFGIFESEKINNILKSKIYVDSTHVYTDEIFNVYLFGIGYSSKVTWETSDGQTSNDRNPVFKFDKPGYISFTATVNQNGIEYKEKFENVVKVIPKLIPDFEVDIRSGNAPLTVKFTSISKGDIKGFKWNFVIGNEKFESIEENPIITFNSTGYVTVELTISDSLYDISKRIDFLISIGAKAIETLQNVKEFDMSGGMIKGLGTFLIDSTIYNLKAINQGGYKNYYSILNIIKPDYSITNKQNFEESNYIKNTSHLFKLFNNYYCIFANNDLTIGHTNYLDKGPPINYNWKGTNHDWDNNKPNCYLTVASDSSIMVGSNYVEGGNSVVCYNKDLNISYSNDKNTLICGIMFNQTDNTYCILEKKGDLQFDNIYQFYKLDLNFNFILEKELKIPGKIKINEIEFIDINRISFCGIDTIKMKAVTGVFDVEGYLLWIETFDNWKEFTKIVRKDTSFFVTGISYLSTGFIEIAFDGRVHKEYAFDCHGIKNTMDLDIFNSNTLILTIFEGAINETGKLFVSKVKYSPLLQANTPDDSTKNPGDSIIGIISPKIKVSPNPATNEVKFEFEEELMVKSIEIYNTEGVLIEILNYAGIKSKEIVLNIKKYSIGIYFVKIQTEKGSSKTKFVKS